MEPSTWRTWHQKYTWCLEIDDEMIAVSRDLGVILFKANETAHRRLRFLKQEGPVYEATHKGRRYRISTI